MIYHENVPFSCPHKFIITLLYGEYQKTFAVKGRKGWGNVEVEKIKKLKKGIDFYIEVRYYNQAAANIRNAGVAELADAQASGACGSNIVWVQVPSPALFFCLAEEDVAS